jgi:hypothetical protein
MKPLQWSLPEFEEKERSRDWYWALGMIVICGAIAAVIYGNYFFAALIILGGILLGFFASKKPQIVDYELNERGLKVGKSLYPYDTIKSFNVYVGPKSHLVIHTAGILMPILAIPVEEQDTELILEIMLNNGVAPDDIRPHASETIMDRLGF